MTKIYCIGELLVDKIGTEKANLAENDRFLKRAGGAPANVAVAASRLGADVTKIATVGEDEFGDFLIQRLEKENVGTENIFRNGKTTLAFVALDQEAKPHFSFYRDADENITKEQLDIEPRKEDIVHLGSLPWTCKESASNVLEFLEKTEATVSFDPNIRRELMTDEYRDTLENILSHTDILIAAEDELDYFEEASEEIEEIITTKGEEGAELIYKGERYSSKPPEVEPVDTTGAGDCLTGSYLAFREEGPEEALEKAVNAAAVSTTSKGAMEALPKRKEIE